MKILNRTPFVFGSLVGRVLYPSFTATVVLKGTFDLRQGETMKPAETQRQLEGDVLSAPEMKELAPACLYDADLAYYKPKADILLAGACHAPRGKPVRVCQVGLKVGKWSKQLAVIGDRRWETSAGIMSAQSTPETFTTMPLTWHRAFGGKGFAVNPAGTGYKRGLLPNFEIPDQLIKGYDDKPKPAGFGPVARTWKSRARKQGTYDKRWMKERFPWQAANFDWTYYNAAPPDQQLDEYLKGDEEVVLENLHPEHARLRCRLPGLRVRCVVRERSGNNFSVREIPLHLDTLFVDADRMQAVLVWRGVAPIADDSWSSLADLALVQEDMAQTPASAEVVLGEAEAAADPLREAPEEPPPIPVDEAACGEAYLALSDDGWRARAQAVGADSPSALQQQLLRLGVVMRRMGLMPPKALSAEAIALSALPPPPEPGRAEGEVLAEALRACKCDEDDLSGRDLAGCNLTGADLSGRVLSGANLAGADLSGANLAKATLESADLSGCNLRGANLEAADLTQARLDGADLSEARLIRALFHQASLVRAKLGGVEANGAVFYQANLAHVLAAGGKFAQADLGQANLAGGDFAGANFAETSLEGANAFWAGFRQANLTNLRASGGADFRGSDFAGAKAAESLWEEARLDGTDFRGAELGRAFFGKANLSQARLLEASAAEAIFRGADLREAKAGNANLLRASFEKANLAAASFVASNLYGAEFLDATLAGADLKGADTKATKIELGLVTDGAGGGKG